MHKRYNQIQTLIDNSIDTIEQAYDEGYKCGLIEGIQTKPLDTEIYELGLTKAWEYVRKVVEYWTKDKTEEIFHATNLQWILTRYPVFEVINAINEYEERQSNEKEK